MPEEVTKPETREAYDAPKLAKLGAVEAVTNGTLQTYSDDGGHAGYKT